MGEQSSKIGKVLEDFAKNTLPLFDWKVLAENKEIKCTRASHQKRTHGIDLLCQYYNPYKKNNQSVIVECKNRQMQSITASSISEWVNELIKNIECSQSSPDLQDLNISDSSFNSGLLLVHANDNFDKTKFYTYLKKVTVPTRRNPINIFIAGNDRINQWIYTYEETKQYDDFKVIYPSINQISMSKQTVSSLDILFSKYFFAECREDEKTECENETTIKRKLVSMMFYFDDISIDNFRYAWSMFKFYQRQFSDKYIFVFYPREEKDIAFINEHFVNTVQRVENDKKEALKVEIKIIKNRELSSINYGGSI